MKNDKIRNKNRFFIQENSRNDININELINELMKIQNDQIFVQFFQLSVEKQQLLFMKLSEIVINENNDLHIIIKSIKLISEIINNDEFFSGKILYLNYFLKYIEILGTKFDLVYYQQILNLSSIFLFRSELLKNNDKIIEFFIMLLDKKFNEYDFTYICNAIVCKPFSEKKKIIVSQIILPYAYKVLNNEVKHSTSRAIHIISLCLSFGFNINLNIILSNLFKFLNQEDEDITNSLLLLLYNLKAPLNGLDSILENLLKKDISERMKMNCFLIFAKFYDFWKYNYYSIFENFLEGETYDIQCSCFNLIAIYTPENVPYSEKLCIILCKSFQYDEHIKIKSATIINNWMNVINNNELLSFSSIINKYYELIIDSIINSNTPVLISLLTNIENLILQR